MTAEPIAKVVAELRAGKFMRFPDLTESVIELAELVVKAPKPVIDATALYESLVEQSDSIDLYGDHSLPPAWEMGDICYVNQHGNVMVMSTYALERQRVGKRWTDTPGWETDQPIDWAEARWEVTSFLFIGGRSTGLGGAMPTRGPVFLLRYAVGQHGDPLDLHWVDLTRRAESSVRMPEEWDMPMLVHLACLDFLACRNVQMVQVQHHNRAERRRMERIGVTVNTLRVRPIGRSSRGAKESGQHGVPLTSIHGHYAHYGNCCPGRHEPHGLAFGKLEGKFWVPQHAVGDPAYGEHHNDYRIDTS